MKYTELKYDELSPDQQFQIWYGSACGHPSNRPRNENHARTYGWEIDAKGNVIGRISRTALAKFF